MVAYLKQTSTQNVLAAASASARVTTKSRSPLSTNPLHSFLDVEGVLEKSTVRSVDHLSTKRSTGLLNVSGAPRITHDSITPERIV